MYKFQMNSDHFQFLFGDRKYGSDVNTEIIWGGNINGVVFIPPYTVGVPTIRYGGSTKLQVEVTDTPRSSDFGWQPLGHFELELPSGQLIFWGPELVDLSQAQSVALSAGSYAGIVLARGGELVTDEMADEGPDEYRIVLWPAHHEMKSKT